MHLHSPSKHSLFGPHGDGLHGSLWIGGSAVIAFGLHWTNGSPSNPSLHVQIGTWFNTWHAAKEFFFFWLNLENLNLNIVCYLLASNPHEPGHGSLHLCWIHACWAGHSLLKTHSGRQFGGAPIKFSKHEQAGLPEIIWQFEFGPHGDGTHDGGLSVGIGSWIIAKRKINMKWIHKINSLINFSKILPILEHCANGSPV